MTKQPAKRPRGRPTLASKGKRAMTPAERQANYMERRLARAAAGMDEDGELHGISADRVERIIDLVAQARDGLITTRQMATRIGRVIGVKFE